MNICVFLGPTLSAQTAAKVLDAVYLPPAAQGDVYLAGNDGAEVIGIIDGYFQGAPSVWHKEILWAMSRGIHVFGSASMGALRAAELGVFGMQGVGRIFEAYRDGEISDDDEVAVVHGPREMGYLAKTVPLVNMRATLCKAVEIGLISEQDQRVLFDSARSLFYWDRSYSALMKQCATRVEANVLMALSDWVSEHAVDQKAEDAIEMLERMRGFKAGPLQVTYHFQRTNAWDDLTASLGARASTQSQTLDFTDQLLDELRLEPPLYRQLDAAVPSGGEDPFHTPHSRRLLVARLKKSAHYEQFAARAAEKARLLNAEYGGLPEYADAMLAPSDVLGWYFEDTCGTTIPMDLDGYAREVGLPTSGALCRMLLRELLFEMALDVEQVNGAPT
jgi:hypothetical protein